MMVPKPFMLLILPVTLACLASCSPAPREFSGGTPQLVAAPDTVSAMLADAATRAASSLETLAAIEQQRGPATHLDPVENVPVELRRAVTVNWIGPADQIVKRLADRAGYTFMPLGAAPPMPIVVSVDVENKPVIEVLRSIGLQLGQRADIRLDGGRRTVELHYPSQAGSGA